MINNDRKGNESEGLKERERESIRVILDIYYTGMYVICTQ